MDRDENTHSNKFVLNIFKKNLQVSKNRFFTQRLNSFESYKHRIRSSLNRLTREVVSKETKVKRNTFCCKKEKKDRYLCMYNNKKKLNTTLEFSQEQSGTVFLCVKKKKCGKIKEQINKGYPLYTWCV